LSRLFQASSYVRYWLEAVNAHSLHAPFLYDFYTKVLKPKNAQTNPQQTSIESIRKAFLEDKTTFQFIEMGAGSKHESSSYRSINTIAKTSLSDLKYSLLYSRIIQYYQCKHVVELGTSLGINTLYLASSNPTTIATFEGDPFLATRAEELFSKQNVAISTIQGNLDDTLKPYLQSHPPVDLAFIDANHRYEPTVRYAHQLLEHTRTTAILILDDIHQSKEMHEAWETLKQLPKVFTSIDLFRCGILFLKPSLTKQHVILQF
jgi:predicted O-methyltransferase YrrM